MRYISSDMLEQLNDNFIVYVNRNVLNSAIVEYEINVGDPGGHDELNILLEMWKRVYESEMKTKRIEVFIKMTKRDIEKCFKNYKLLPLGSFGINQE